MSLDEYEIKRSLAHKIHSESSWAREQERRKDADRRKAASLRRKLNDRRQRELAFEHERRLEQRRRAERRSFKDRRVTSDWSEMRLQEEREKLKSKQESEGLFTLFVLIFFSVLAFFIYMVLNSSQ